MQNLAYLYEMFVICMQTMENSCRLIFTFKKISHPFLLPALFPNFKTFKPSSTRKFILTLKLRGGGAFCPTFKNIGLTDTKQNVFLGVHVNLVYKNLDAY